MAWNKSVQEAYNLAEPWKTEMTKNCIFKILKLLQTCVDTQEDKEELIVPVKSSKSSRQLYQLYRKKHCELL